MLLIDDRFIYASSRIRRLTTQLFSYTYGYTIFGGDGSDGDLTVSASATLDGTIHQYDNLTINASQTLSCADAAPTGLFILVKNKLVINGTISANGVGALGGVGGTAAVRATLGMNAYNLSRDATILAGIGLGAGGGGGGSASYVGVAGGGAGGAGGIGGTIPTGNGAVGTATSNIKISQVILGGLDANLFVWGAGGGGGEYAVGADGGAGGNGGGILYIECGKLFFNTGAILSANGANGVASTNGAGGGGGGGLLLVRAKSIETNNGTLSVAGGTGGVGGAGDGGNGAEGLAILSELG